MVGRVTQLILGGITSSKLGFVLRKELVNDSLLYKVQFSVFAHWVKLLITVHKS